MRKQWMAAAAAVMALWGSAHAESMDASQAQALKRAEVQADLELWHKAGMSFLAPAVQYSDVKESAEYRRYQQLRNGPAFQEAVAKHMGAAQTTAQQATPAAQP